MNTNKRFTCYEQAELYLTKHGCAIIRDGETACIAFIVLPIKAIGIKIWGAIDYLTRSKKYFIRHAS
jgi:hypothetical protein